MTNYRIDIVSDTICPWCYVGKKRLEAAIAQHQQLHPSDTFSTTWHAFQLAPEMTGTVDKQAHYEKRIGAARTQLMQGHMKRLGQELGINFAFGGRVGNTRDSHRLILLAKRLGGEQAQTKVVEQLFESYFEKNEDITSPSVLLACATAAGLDPDTVEKYLVCAPSSTSTSTNSTTCANASDREFEQDLLAARAKVISGVPHFTINGEYEIAGAEEPPAFLRAFEGVKALEERDIKGRAERLQNVERGSVGVVFGNGVC